MQCLLPLKTLLSFAFRCRATRPTPTTGSMALSAGPSSDAQEGYSVGRRRYGRPVSGALPGKAFVPPSSLPVAPRGAMLAWADPCEDGDAPVGTMYGVDATSSVSSVEGGHGALPARRVPGGSLSPTEEEKKSDADCRGGAHPQRRVESAVLFSTQRATAARGSCPDLGHGARSLAQRVVRHLAFRLCASAAGRVPVVTAPFHTLYYFTVCWRCCRPNSRRGLTGDGAH